MVVVVDWLVWMKGCGWLVVGSSSNFTRYHFDMIFICMIYLVITKKKLRRKRVQNTIGISLDDCLFTNEIFVFVVLTQEIIETQFWEIIKKGYV